jgi:hypothetical protein
MVEHSSMGEGSEMAFMRFTDDHHNIVLFSHLLPLWISSLGDQHMAIQVAIWNVELQEKDRGSTG